MKRTFALSMGILALVAAVAGCSHKGPASSAVGAVASSTAISQASSRAQAQVSQCLNSVGVTALLTSSGRTRFFGCVKAIASPGKQATLKNCLLNAASGDQMWLSSGRHKFETVDAPACLDAAA
jgi:hypothetical protein